MEHGKMTAMDKEYQSKDDAMMMMRAMEIMKDKPRYQACLKQLKKMKDAGEMAMGMMKEKHG